MQFLDSYEHIVRCKHQNCRILAKKVLATKHTLSVRTAKKRETVSSAVFAYHKHTLNQSIQEPDGFTGQRAVPWSHPEMSG